MSLNVKEEQQLRDLLKKANVIWQYYEKENIAEHLTDEQWSKFVSTKQDNFCEGACYVVMDILGEFESELNTEVK
jgi:hypothetical protein